MNDKYLDLDALPKREGERTLADVRKDGGTAEEQRLIHARFDKAIDALHAKVRRDMGL